MPEKQIAPVRPELLVTIVDKTKASFYEDFLSAYSNLQFTADGYGTARFLGITDTEKAVIISIIKKDDLEKATELLDRKFKTVRNGDGICAAIPMESVIGTLIYRYLIGDMRTEI